jgi:putative oxidoreductase
MSTHSIRERRWIQFGLTLIVGGAFIYAGWVGLIDPLQLADNVASFRILPPLAVVPFALSLPIFEITAGALTIAGPMRRSAALGLTIMTAIFCVAIASALARGLVIDCGCFGASIPSRERMWLDLGRDVLLLAGVLTIYRLSGRCNALLRGAGLPTVMNGSD